VSTIAGEAQIPVLSFLGGVAGFGISWLGNAPGFLSSVQAISLMAAFGAMIAQAHVIIDRTGLSRG